MNETSELVYEFYITILTLTNLYLFQFDLFTKPFLPSKTRANPAGLSNIQVATFQLLGMHETPAFRNLRLPPAY